MALLRQHREQIEEIADLESRVAALVRILEDAGVEVPPAAVERTNGDTIDELMGSFEAFLFDHSDVHAAAHGVSGSDDVSKSRAEVP